MKKTFTTNICRLLFIGAVTLFSCNKKEEVDPVADITKTTCKLTGFDQGVDGSFPPYHSVYEYNAQGYLAKATLNRDDDSWVTVYQYNSSNKLVRISQEDGSYQEYEYNASGLMSKMTRVQPNENVFPQPANWTEAYTYDEKGKVIRLVRTSPDSENVKSNTFEYDDRGNVSRKNEYRNGREDGYVLYEDYDDKFNPFFVLKGMTLDPEQSLNNYRRLTKVWMVDLNGDGKKEERKVVYTYTYKYNTSGLVTERTTKYEDGSEDLVETFTYTGCK